MKKIKDYFNNLTVAKLYQLNTDLEQATYEVKPPSKERIHAAFRYIEDNRRLMSLIGLKKSLRTSIFKLAAFRGDNELVEEITSKYAKDIDTKAVGFCLWRATTFCNNSNYLEQIKIIMKNISAENIPSGYAAEALSISASAYSSVEPALVNQETFPYLTKQFKENIPHEALKDAFLSSAEYGGNEKKAECFAKYWGDVITKEDAQAAIDKAYSRTDNKTKTANYERYIQRIFM